MTTAAPPKRLGYGDLLKMQSDLGTPYNRAIWNIHSTSGKLNILRGLAVVSAGALAAYAATAHGLSSPVALAAGALTLGSFMHFVLSNLLALRIIVVAEWILRLGAGNLEYRIALSGRDQLAWMCEALDRLRRRSVEVVKLPRARELAEALEGQNRELEDRLRRLRRTQDQLVAQHKANEIGELAAGVAHEIRNPFNFVQNFAEGAAELAGELGEHAEAHRALLGEAAGRKLAGLHEEARENLETIVRNTQRANRIIERVLDLGDTVGEHRSIDLNEIVAEHARIAAHSEPGGAGDVRTRLEFGLGEDVGAVTANARGIGRLINNLVTNACDAVRERKPGAGAEYEPQVRIETERVAERVAIVVRDNGTGIDPAVADRVTEPFFTTKPPESGTGLGLSQCEDIVREHEGELVIASTPEDGTSVRVELPRRGPGPG